MRNKFAIGTVTALLLAAGAVAFAQSEPGTTTTKEFTFQGKTQSVFKDERVLLMKVDNIIPASMGPEASRAGVQIGHLCYVHVNDMTQVIDEDGKSRKRERGDDEGWKEIDKEGSRLQITLTGERREVNLRGDEVKGLVNAYEARRVLLLGK